MSGDSGRQTRVRYVGDDGGTDAFRRALERQPAFSVTVRDGVDAGPPLAADGIDCVVLVHGESVDGVAALERIRDAAPGLPVVLVAPTDDAMVARAVGADVTEFVPASLDDAPRALVERVRSAVGSRGRAAGRSGMPIEDLGVREELRLKGRAMEAAPVGITISDPAQPDNPLIYVNDAFEELTGYTKAETVGRNCRFLQGPESDPEAIAAMRDAIDREEPVSVELVNYRKDGEAFWNKVDVAPIRGEDGEVTNYVGFQTDVTARKEAEFELERERRRLDHLLDRINGLLQDVHGDLVQAVSRDAVQRAVCERIAAADAYECCWIGDLDRSRDVVVPAYWAGAWDPQPGDLEVDLGGADGDPSPVAAAYEKRAVQVVDDPADLAALAADADLDPDRIAGVAAIPLVYRDTIYGVLAVYTADGDALDERETVVLESLGRAAATAVNALERERIITADSVVELEFEVRDRDLFVVDLSARLDATFEYEGSVHREDGSLLLFFTTDADPAAVERSATDCADVEAAALVNEHDSGALFQFQVGPGTLVTTLAERGARTRAIDATDGVGHVTVELPTEADARAVVDRLRERYPETELVAYRERERPPETKQSFIDELEAALTERQLTALQTAYVSGFYEWNRPVSGDELAESMDIARSTFHQHLRAAERKLVGELFED